MADVAIDPPPTGIPTPTNVIRPRSEVDSALDILREVLGSVGLTGLDEFLRTQIVEGTPEELIWIRLEETPQFAQRFPAIVQLRQLQGQNPNLRVDIPTISEYLQYEKSLAGLAASVGLFNLATRDLATELLVGQVSIAEVSRRLSRGFDELQSMPAEVRTAFMDYYGIGGDLALFSYLVDTDRTEAQLNRDIDTAIISGAARLAEVGIGRNLAGRISDLGVSFEQALQGFSRVSRLEPLTRGTVSDQRIFSAGQLSEAVFGLSAGLARDVERRLEERSAQFGGGGGADLSGRYFGAGSA